MSKQTVHFIYTVPRGNFVYRAVLKFLSFFGLPPLHRYGINFLIPWKRPVRAPHSISFNLLKALKAKYRVRFYSLYEHTVCKTKEGDIVLAQPAPITNDNPPKEIDKKSVTYRTFYERSNIKKVIIMPYSGDIKYTAWWKDLVRDHGDNCLFFSGQVWFDRWSDSPFKDLDIKNKLRLNMGIDLGDYPRIKNKYNKKGERGILYVGHTSWYKNTIELERLAKRLSPKIKLGHIGGGNISGWKKIADFADLTPEYMSEIAKDYDIFINVSSGDPQVTTVLESMAFGFVVACTPESGYEFPSLIKLSTNNTDDNIIQLEKIQNMDDVQIESLIEKNMQIIKKQYLWPGVEAQVLDFLEKIK